MHLRGLSLAAAGLKRHFGRLKTHAFSINMHARVGGRRCITDQTKAFFLTSQEKVSPEPIISVQFYINPPLFITLVKKSVARALSKITDRSCTMFTL